MTDRLALRPREAAATLGISQRTLRELLKNGDIPHTKLDRAILIAVADLENFLKRKTNPHLGES